MSAVIKFARFQEYPGTALDALFCSLAKTGFQHRLPLSHNNYFSKFWNYQIYITPNNESKRIFEHRFDIRND
jgi:hypothetical protein